MPEFQTPSQYFQRAGARPRKRFGQNFLTQPATAARIVESAELEASDIAVEIGPGLGALTRYVAPLVNRLHLIELDREMAAYLREVFSIDEADTSGSGVKVYEEDALSFDFAALGRKEGRRLVLLGNLPYNISSPLAFHLLEAFPAIDRAVFMVQKEVGERFAAGPGTGDYGVLSVLLGVYARVRKLFTVGPAQFYPPPKVDSLVIRIDFAEDPFQGQGFDPGFDFLRKLVSLAFQKRRKTLHNSLKGCFGISAQALSDAFEKAGIDPGRRPETLAPPEFTSLAAEICKRVNP